VITSAGRRTFLVQAFMAALDGARHVIAAYFTQSEMCREVVQVFDFHVNVIA
jgi:hypothetical protein